jgi:hypothetical protein
VVVEMPVHAVEPRHDPAAARFEERNDHAAPDHVIAASIISIGPAG